MTEVESATATATRPTTSARPRRRRSRSGRSSTTSTRYENVLGYSGTNSQVRPDHEVRLLQQRRRHRPEHARLRAVRADRDRESSRTTTSSGTTSTTSCRTRGSRPSPAASADDRGGSDDPVPDRGRRRRCSAPTAGSSRTTTSSATSSGAPRRSRIPFNEGDNAITHRQPVPQQHDGPRRHRHERRRLLQRRLGQRQLLLGQRQLDVRPERPAMPDSSLYPTCPAPPPPARAPARASATTTQFGDLLGYVATDPPREPGVLWAKHAHPAFEKFKPLDVTPGPDVRMSTRQTLTRAAPRRPPRPRSAVAATGAERCRRRPAARRRRRRPRSRSPTTTSRRPS